MKLFSWLTVALFAGFALAILTSHGCAGNCGTNCPNGFVQIGSPDNVMLAVPNGGLSWSGPACPAAFPQCSGDGVTTSCTYIDIYGVAEGYCDLTIAFSDRPAEVVRAEFGPRITQGCCTGYSVAGPKIFYIPDSPTKGLIYADGGTDAVSVLPDASADGAEAAHDAGRDSLPADAK